MLAPSLSRFPCPSSHFYFYLRSARLTVGSCSSVISFFTVHQDCPPDDSPAPGNPRARTSWRNPGRDFFSPWPIPVPPWGGGCSVLFSLVRRNGCSPDSPPRPRRTSKVRRRRWMASPIFSDSRRLDRVSILVRFHFFDFPQCLMLPPLSKCLFFLVTVFVSGSPHPFVRLQGACPRVFPIFEPVRPLSLGNLSPLSLFAL